MYISENYLTSEFEDARTHLKNMLKDALEEMQNLYSSGPKFLSYYDAVDTLNIILEFADLYEIECTKLKQSSPQNGDQVIKVLNTFYFEVVTKEVVTPYKELFNKKVYVFSQIDYDSIQESINTLRTDISKSEKFEAEHKERLLKKLEGLQREIHKKMGSLDKVLGIIVSIGHTLGKTTEEAKPFIDEVKNILEIVFKSKAKVENLPDVSNQLETTEIFQIENIEEVGTV